MTASDSGDSTRLTSTERKYLRGVAHPLKPVVHVGKGGLTETVLAATRRALEDHELIKVKIGADRDERARIAAELEKGCDAELAGAVGTIAILYRRQPDPERRRITFPSKTDSPPPAGGGEN
ncbi:MAG TPA: ribosome assembly RNA-binding protein YhbY [Candidatus Limnocylindrales bacterium]|nr:ribosome assembly RNA-binding protein YhbY [Candidatus Limnocylindrales bacterium]